MADEAQILCCCGCGIDRQLHPNSTPSLGTSICRAVAKKRKKKKERKKEGKWPRYFSILETSLLLPPACGHWFSVPGSLKHFSPIIPPHLHHLTRSPMVHSPLPFFFPLPLFKAVFAAYVSSQARGLIGAAAADLHHSHSNMGSEPHLRPTPQLTAMLDP